MRYVVFLPETPLPATSGGRIANQHLCNGLVAMGHEVIVVGLCGADTVLAAPWPTRCLHVRPVRWRPGYALWKWRLTLDKAHSPFAIERSAYVGKQLQAALNQLDPDVVIFHHTYGWWPSDLPDLLIAHNIETSRLSGTNMPGNRKVETVAAIERAALNGAGALAVYSDSDRERAWRIAPDCNPMVVPLGVQPSGSPRTHQPDKLRSVAFIGSFDYEPNREAAEALAGLAPNLAAMGIDRILLAGRAADSLPADVSKAPGIEIRSDVTDMEGLFRAQHLLIVPLINAGGVRVKVLEAWALGVPVVSTAVGIEGLGARHGIDALIGETPKDLVELVASASDPRLRTTLADCGWQRWSECYTPVAAASAIDALARRVLSGSKENLPC